MEGLNGTGRTYVLNEQLKGFEMVYDKNQPDQLKIALASARFVDRDLAYNLDQIQRWMLLAAQDSANLICFGEAFLQGFDALDWRYETDRDMAVALDSAVFQRLCALPQETGVDLLLGFLERDGETLHSSCALLSGGRLLHLYRRISRGWKEYWSTDGHYREGSEIRPFIYHGRTCLTALCGDLWDAPERFALGADLLFWPVYISYTPREWLEGVQEEYAAQAAKVCGRVLMINSLCDGDGYGGACYFHNGAVSAALPMGQEGLLYVEI